VTVSDAAAGSGTSVTRTVTVSYTAQSSNAFMGMFGKTSIGLAGSSQGKAAGAPNINFYLLLDSSPSMLLGATPADQSKLQSKTTSQDNGAGCAFACHETCPSCDGLTVDNYTVARQNGVTLRIDNLKLATQNLMTTAQTEEASTNAQYQMAIYTFDIAFNTIQTLTSSLTVAQSAASNIQALTVYKNNWVTSSNDNSDADTDYDNAMTKINSVMPAPGNGTNASGDTPQEVLFFVTDGMEDEGSTRLVQPMNYGNPSNSLCTTIKNRGIRIAVLYTTYVPPTADSWYEGYTNSKGIKIASFLPSDPTKTTPSAVNDSLQACASPGLFTAVGNGGDISTALTELFNQVVSTAYLAK
jgi:hypothetical protein